MDEDEDDEDGDGGFSVSKKDFLVCWFELFLKSGLVKVRNCFKFSCGNLGGIEK